MGIRCWRSACLSLARSRHPASWRMGWAHSVSALAQRDAPAAARVAARGHRRRATRGHRVGPEQRAASTSLSGAGPPVTGTRSSRRSTRRGWPAGRRGGGANGSPLVLAARDRDPIGVVRPRRRSARPLFYLELARAVTQAFSGDRRAVGTADQRAVSKRSTTSAAIYEEFTLGLRRGAADRRLGSTTPGCSTGCADGR